MKTHNASEHEARAEFHKRRDAVGHTRAVCVPSGSGSAVRLWGSGSQHRRHRHRNDGFLAQSRRTDTDSRRAHGARRNNRLVHHLRQPRETHPRRRGAPHRHPRRGRGRCPAPRRGVGGAGRVRGRRETGRTQRGIRPQLHDEASERLPAAGKHVDRLARPGAHILAAHEIASSARPGARVRSTAVHAPCRRRRGGDVQPVPHPAGSRARHAGAARARDRPHGATRAMANLHRVRVFRRNASRRL